MENEIYWRITTITLIEDEKTGKPKKLREYYLVKGFTTRDAEAKVFEMNKNLALTWRISEVKETNFSGNIE